jgi:hypothetical protein
MERKGDKRGFKGIKAINKWRFEVLQTPAPKIKLTNKQINLINKQVSKLKKSIK